jgi:chemotaxis methyl-accepting protein methylase
MENKLNTEQEIEKTLESLNGIQRAAANPYLFTRIKARMQKEEKGFWELVTGFIAKPAIAIAAILLIVVINLTVFFQSQSEQTSTGQEEEQLFASEYNLSGTTIYDATVDQQ